LWRPAEVGTQTFDGKGATTGSATLSSNGNIFQFTFTGTYTVNADCTGTFTLQIASVGVTQHVFFVIDDSGNEFRAIETDPGFVGTRIGRRQFSAGDFQGLRRAEPSRHLPPSDVAEAPGGFGCLAIRLFRCGA
jgi:hypothetical protein